MRCQEGQGLEGHMGCAPPFNPTSHLPESVPNLFLIVSNAIEHAKELSNGSPVAYIQLSGIPLWPDIPPGIYSP